MRGHCGEENKKKLKRGERALEKVMVGINEKGGDRGREEGKRRRTSQERGSGSEKREAVWENELQDTEHAMERGRWLNDVGWMGRMLGVVGGEVEKKAREADDP